MSSLSNFFSSGGQESKGTNYLPQQATWLKNLLATYGSQVGQGQNVYSGDRVAGLTDAQQGILGSLGNWSQYLQPTTGSALYGQTGAALSDLLSGEMGAEPYTEESVNALFKSAYEAPAMKQWSEVTKPAIQEAFSGPGYWSTARMNEQAEGAQDLADTLSGQYGQLRWNAETANKDLAEAAAGRALSAVPTALDYGNVPITQALSGLSGLSSMYNLASAQQQQQQAEITAAMQKWAEENEITDPTVLQTILSLLGLKYETSSGTKREAGLGYDAANNFFSSLGQMGSNSNNAGMMQALAMIGA